MTSVASFLIEKTKLILESADSEDKTTETQSIKYIKKNKTLRTKHTNKHTFFTFI